MEIIQVKPFTAILFDLDGTLTDSKEGIFRSLNYAFTKLGMEKQPDAMLEKFIGPSLASVFLNEYSFSVEQADQAVRFYREYYSEKGYLECSLFPGIEKLLAELKMAHKKLALATKKPEIFAGQILKAFHIDCYFDVIKGSDLADKSEHKISIVESAVDLLKEKKENCVLVGDSKYDILAAKEIGIASVGVLFGYGSQESLRSEGADYIAKDTDSLYNLFINGEYPQL